MPALLIIFTLANAAQPTAADLTKAYRLDSLQTKALNHAALSRLPPVAANPAPVKMRSAPTAAELDLAAREQRAVQAWRDRQADCAAGKQSSCD